jgi:hypothetical protein
MKLGVWQPKEMWNNWRLSRKKLNADPNTYNATNYLTLNHAGNATNNFFNSLYSYPSRQK